MSNIVIYLLWTGTKDPTVMITLCFLLFTNPFSRLMLSIIVFNNVKFICKKHIPSTQTRTMKFNVDLLMCCIRPDLRATAEYQHIKTNQSVTTTREHSWQASWLQILPFHL